MSPAAPDPEPPPLLPPLLVEQLALVTAHFTAGPATGGETMLRMVDAGLLNISEIAEVDFALLNRILALRTAVERYAQLLDADYKIPWADREAARIRAEEELAALEEALWEARPSATTRAMGGGW